MAKNQPLMERFWSKVDKCGEDDCWEWQGKKNGKGHGEFYLNWYRRVLAHRFMYWLGCGHICEGDGADNPSYIRHTCGNPSCVNPKHLSKKEATLN